MQDIPLLRLLVEDTSENSLLYDVLINSRYPIVLCPPVSSILSKMPTFVRSSLVLLRGSYTLSEIRADESGFLLWRACSVEASKHTASPWSAVSLTDQISSHVGFPHTSLPFVVPSCFHSQAHPNGHFICHRAVLCTHGIVLSQLGQLYRQHVTLPIGCSYQRLWRPLIKRLPRT